MRIKSFYDKIGLSSLGAGLDGLFIHSDLTNWMEELAPYILLIIIKISLIVIGIYLLHLYNKSKSLEEISLKKEDILQKKNSFGKTSISVSLVFIDITLFPIHFYELG